MSTYRRAGYAGGVYFFTVVTCRRRPMLCEEPVRAALREAIEVTRITCPFTIDGWVLLPDHLHCLWTLPEGDADFGKRWSMIKRYASQHCGPVLQSPERLTGSRQRRRESTLWQRRFWEHLIRDETDLQNHMDYLHYNPVRHGLVSRVQDWPYSTFHRYVREGVYPPDWGGTNDAHPQGSFGEPGVEEERRSSR